MYHDFLFLNCIASETLHVIGNFVADLEMKLMEMNEKELVSEKKIEGLVCLFIFMILFLFILIKNYTLSWKPQEFIFKWLAKIFNLQFKDEGKTICLWYKNSLREWLTFESKYKVCLLNFCMTPFECLIIFSKYSVIVIIIMNTVYSILKIELFTE